MGSLRGSGSVELFERNNLIIEIVPKFKMRFTVKDPLSGAPILLKARVEQNHHELGYRITYPDGSSFFISNRLGTWKSADDHPIDPELLEQIGLAIEGLKAYNE
jgi:hypothetical protein